MGEHNVTVGLDIGTTSVKGLAVDDDGHGRSDIKIAAKVTKKGSDVEVDLSDSDPQSTSFVNSSHANMQAAVAMAFAYLIDAEIPKNTGALRPLKVVAKQGTIVWADPGRQVMPRAWSAMAGDAVVASTRNLPLCTCCITSIGVANIGMLYSVTSIGECSAISLKWAYRLSGLSR